MEIERERFREPLNIRQLVKDAIVEFTDKTSFRVDVEVENVLTMRGQRERRYLEEEYRRRKFTTIELSEALSKLLFRAMRMARERDISRINTALIEETMKIDCPFYPWC